MKQSKNSIIREQQKRIGFLEAKLKTMEQSLENAAHAYDQLQRRVDELLRYRFGSRRERYIETGQLSLLSSEDEESHVVSSEEVDFIEVAAHKKRRGGRNMAKNLPRREVIIPVPPEERTCKCGKEKKVIGYDISEIINYIPAVYEIIVEKREKMVCTCDCSSPITEAPKPEHILPKSKVSESFLANIIVSKILDRQPLYHLEKIFQNRYGLDISRNSMARWMIDVSYKLQPLVNLFQDEILNYSISAIDATTLQVLQEEGRLAQTKSYVYCIRGGPPNRKGVVYEYNAILHKKFLASWFEEYQGMIHCDADNFFEDLGDTPGISLSYCNAHARRKFEPIAKEADDGIAKYAMKYFQKLYSIERYAKVLGMDPEQRKALRQEKSKPIINEFKHWLDAVYSTVLPKSPLGGAVAYCLNHWEGLIRFLDEGRLEIDNNLTEQAIKPFVIARKNFLFACSVEGAKALCVHFSLIRTATQHGLDPYKYYLEIFNAIPYCKTTEDYEALLPWNIKLEKVKQAA
jgi:transposase